MAKKHAFKFFRAGGFDQVRLDTGADILAIGQLDQKLWVALSCPVSGLEFDKKTLEIVDADKDGRIRAPELIAAVKWVGEVLKDPDVLLEGTDKIALSEIDTSNEEGKRVHSSAKQILKNLGKKETKEITLEDTLDTVKVFSATKFNGDGIVPVASAEDPAIQKAIEDIIACMGSEADRSGVAGVSQTIVDAFFTDATAMGAWWKLADDDAANVLPLGKATDEGAAASRAVKVKVDDYFTRCKLAAFDARAANAMNRDEAEYQKLASTSLSSASSLDLPLAHIEADRPLPLERGLNPAWSEAIKTLRAKVSSRCSANARPSCRTTGTRSRANSSRTRRGSRRSLRRSSMGSARRACASCSRATPRRRSTSSSPKTKRSNPKRTRSRRSRSSFACIAICTRCS